MYLFSYSFLDFALHAFGCAYAHVGDFVLLLQLACRDVNGLQSASSLEETIVATCNANTGWLHNVSLVFVLPLV